jgi:hypothetical protein
MARRRQPLHRATSFSEYKTGADGKKVPVWFALDEGSPLAAFARIWTNRTTVRGRQRKRLQSPKRGANAFQVEMSAGGAAVSGAGTMPG